VRIVDFEYRADVIESAQGGGSPNLTATVEGDACDGGVAYGAGGAELEINILSVLRRHAVAQGDESEGQDRQGRDRKTGKLSGWHKDVSLNFVLIPGMRHRVCLRSYRE
jgi:hypothetical protein